MAKFIHDMGMSLEETVLVFERIIFSLGFEIKNKMKKDKDNEIEIKAFKNCESLKLIFKPQESRIMNIPRTIVEVYCSKTLHELIQERIRTLKCGG